VTSMLTSDALAIGSKWLSELSLANLTKDRLASSGLLEDGVRVDVVAIGKASREMAGAIEELLGDRVLRQLVVCDKASASLAPLASTVLIGEHPVPGEGSRNAGMALVAFLDEETHADCTLFLLSGGASSLCVLPEAPLMLGDLRGVWDAALATGADITTLNKIRASSSQIAGGGVVRRVRTPRSQSFVLVDNVISGAEWVASGMTYDYAPTRDDVMGLLGQIGLTDTPLGQRLLDAYRRRAQSLARTSFSNHENAILAEPAMMLDVAVDEARRRGYRVVNMGAHVHGDAVTVSEDWTRELERAQSSGDSVAVLGVGEVTIKVRGSGRGGRCQELAWLMTRGLAGLARDAAFVARASDGRDFVEGVGGAWADRSSEQRARELGIDWASIAQANDSYTALREIGQLLDGGHTGWNLCDLYVALT
jgi:glycerate 2-kinase